MTPASEPTRLPVLAKWLLGVAPVSPESRADVASDLHELYVGRRRDLGLLYARWRLYHDVLSLWSQRTSVEGTARRPFAMLHDVRGDLRYAARLFARQPGILLLTIAGDDLIGPPVL